MIKPAANVMAMASTATIVLFAWAFALPAFAQIPDPGAVFRDCADCPEMVVLPPGSFMMGSPDSEAGRDKDEAPLHSVSINYRFAVGRYEVTRGQYARFLADSGHVSSTASNCFYLNLGTGTGVNDDASKDWRNPGFAQGDDHPVVCVNWNDAKAYAAWLSRRTARNYRLLTEAEWEYAARAGSNAARPWGDNAHEACSYANGATEPETGNWSSGRTAGGRIRTTATTVMPIPRRWEDTLLTVSASTI